MYGQKENKYKIKMEKWILKIKYKYTFNTKQQAWS